MNAESAYVIQSLVIPLGRVPFDVGKNLRSAFRPMFLSSNCFKDMRAIILDESPHAKVSSPTPFVRDLGQVCFSTKSVRLDSPYYLPQLLNRERQPLDLFGDFRYFGFDRSLEDQRMNALYFELRQPLHISATSAGNSQAGGKIFVHFYPSGHIIIHLAIALKPYPQGNLHELKRYVVETRPWRLDNRWMWTSRLGNGSLSETVNHVKKRLFTSMFIDGGEHLHDGQWHTTMKLVTREHAEDVAAHFFKGQYGTFRLHDSEPGYKHRAENPDQLPTYVDHEFILSSKQGVICILSPSRDRKSALRLFWRIFTLREFVMLKHCVYGQYSDHLREEIPNLKEYRLSTLRKLKKEDLRRLSVYDRQMPRYFQALDRHIRKTKPFYRKMYSSLSSGTGFDERRADVMSLVTTWESEVEQWEHSAVVIWRRLISPIRALLAGSR